MKVGEVSCWGIGTVGTPQGLGVYSRTVGTLPALLESFLTEHPCGRWPVRLSHGRARRRDCLYQDTGREGAEGEGGENWSPLSPNAGGVVE